MPSIKFDAIIETAKVVSGFEQIQNAVKETASRVEKEGKSIDDVISNIQKSMDIAIGGWTVSKFVNEIMQVRGQFQQTEMAFKTMLQSEEKANELMQQMIHTAAITPFGVEDVTEGAKQLLAFNVAADEVNDTLIRLGDVSAGMGLNLSDMVMLYGTTIAKGKMDTQDLYQFLNRGIPIADSLAKVMGLDVSNAIKEVQKQIKAGKVTSDVFISAMQNMTAEGSKFGGLMEAQSQTITGQISNIEDAIEQMFNELGKSQEGVINTGLDIVSKLVDNWRTLGEVLLTVVAAYGAYKAAVLVMVAISKAQIALKTAQAFLSLASSITSAKDAMALFNLVSKANVLGLVAGAIAAAVAYFNLFGDSVADAAETAEKFGEDAQKATNHVESLISILKNAESGSKVYKDTIKELSDIYSNYGIELTKIAEDESNLLDVKNEEIQKSQELVEQIRLEATERNRANAISNANSQYNNAIEGAVKNLTSGLTEDFGTTGAGLSLGIQNIVTPQEIERINQLQDAMESATKGSKEWQEAKKQLSIVSMEQYNKLKMLIEANGLDATSINKVMKYYNAYFGVLHEAQGVYSSTIQAINKGADATENLGGKTTTTKERVEALQKQLQGAGEDVHTLYNRVKAFMQDYSENNIYFKVNFDAEVPAWMQKMDIPELGRLGKYFSALARDLANNKKSGIKVNGKWMSTQDIAQRGYDYTNAANQKQTKVDEKKKAAQRKKEEDEANAKKNAAAKKKAAAEAKKKAEDQKKAQEELNDEQEQLVQQNIDDNISQMKDGTEKKIAEIKNDYAKRKAEIEKQEKEFKKKNKEAGKNEALTTEQQNAIDEANNLNENNELKKLLEVSKEEEKAATEALQSYLIKYGDYEQKRLAITQQYEQKIKEAKSVGESMSLTSEMQKELNDLAMKEFNEKMDWETIFNGLDTVSVAHLQKLKENLRSMLNSKDILADQAKVITERINTISKQITKKKNAWKEAFGVAIPELEKINQLEQDALDAKEKLVEAQERYNAALAKNQEYQSNIAQYLGQYGINVESKDVTSQNSQNLISQMQSLGQSTQDLSSMFSQLGQSEQGLSQATQGLQGAQAASSAASGAAAGASGGAGGAAMTLAIIEKIITTINKNVQSMTDLLEEMGSSDSTFARGWSSFAQSSQYATNGFQSLKEGNVVGVASNVLGSLRTLGDAFGKWGISGFGSSDDELEEAVERLTQSNENLQTSIDALADRMDDANSMTDIGSAYEQQKKYLEQSIENTKELMRREGDVSSSGFFGIGSKASSNYKINEHMSQEDWKRISDIVGTSVTSAQDFWNLTSKQMSDVAAYAGDLYDKIKDYADDGYGDAAQYMDAYIEYYKKLEELEDERNEKFTNVSFDTLVSDFQSALEDMDNSTEDFTEDFEELMRSAIVNSMITETYKEKLHDWYEKFSSALSDGELSKEEKDNLYSQYQSIIQDAVDERDALFSTLKVDSSSGSQSATSGSWESMGQDTADELNGRFTALQIAGESIADNIIETVSQMQNIITLGISTNGAVLEIRNMMINTNSYLEDIVKYAKLTYDDFGSKIDELQSTLKKL